jgi:hypothetical protein
MNDEKEPNEWLKTLHSHIDNAPAGATDEVAMAVMVLEVSADRLVAADAAGDEALKTVLRLVRKQMEILLEIPEGVPKEIAGAAVAITACADKLADALDTDDDDLKDLAGEEYSCAVAAWDVVKAKYYPKT